MKNNTDAFADYGKEEYLFYHLMVDRDAARPLMSLFPFVTCTESSYSVIFHLMISVILTMFTIRSPISKTHLKAH